MKGHCGTQILSVLGLVAVLMVAFFVGNPAQSQANDVTGVVTGYVYDVYNRPLDQARVFLRADDTPVSIRTVNRNGFFSFLAVLPGKYVVVSGLEGYDDTLSCKFTIYPNQTKSVHLRMWPTLRTISHITTRRLNQCPADDPLISF